MSGQQHALYPVLTQLCQEPRADGRGQVVAIVSPQTGSGTSYVSRTLALMAAEHYGPYGQRVGLIDLDFSQQAQSTYFQTPAAQSKYGTVHGPYDATFGEIPFWQVSPDSIAADGLRQGDGLYCCLHLVAETGLAFTQFQWSQIKQGQAVHLAHVREYWHKLREHFALVIIDTPAFDRADMALTVIPEADQTAIVNLTDRSNDPENAELASRITAAGGRCAGIILNGGTAPGAAARYPS